MYIVFHMRNRMADDQPLTAHSLPANGYLYATRFPRLKNDVDNGLNLYLSSDVIIVQIKERSNPADLR